MLVAKFEFTFYANETDVTTKMRFNFEASDRQDDDGSWEGSDMPSDQLAEIYFGHKDGAWDTKRVEKGSESYNIIWMREYEDPSGIKVVWKDSPDRLAALTYKSRVPFMVGEHGSGYTWGHPKLEFSWKIIAT